MRMCSCCGAAPRLRYAPFCVDCNHEWMNSDERSTVEHVEAMALETFKLRVRARKAGVAAHLDGAARRAVR